MARFNHLQTIGFRNLKDQQTIHFDGGLNFFFGINGSGKSNLIEAIHLFSHARSFRSTPIEQIIKQNQTQFVLRAEIVEDGGNQLTELGIQRDLNAETLIKVNHNKVSKYSELAAKIAIKTLSTDKSNQLDLSPKHRRAELDWQLFHVKHENLKFFTELSQILKNKNALLKDYRLKGGELQTTLEPWNFQLAQVSVSINKGRIEAMAETIKELTELATNPIFNEIQRTTFDLTLGYPKNLLGLDEDQVFEFLCQNLSKEKKAQQSLYGPQRADVVYHTDESKTSTAKDYFSRGQKKLISIFFSIAQINVLKKYGKKAVFCLDDAHAELDSRAFNGLMKLLTEQGIQCFITVPKKSFVQLQKHGKIFQIANGIILD